LDVLREKKPSRRPLIIAGSAIAIVLCTLGISQIKPASPTLESSSLFIDTVKRGEMVREVRGNGTLVPEDQRIVSALTSGRVERVLIRAGERVSADAVLIEMSNPDVQLQGLDAERQLKLAEAELASLRASLEGQRLAAASSVATAKLAMRDAERAVSVAERLVKEGLNSSFDVERARDQAEESRTRLDSEQRRLEVLAEALDAQLALRRSEVDRLKAIAAFQHQRVASLRVRAGADGVVQEMLLEPGQWVNPGERLARVAGTGRLKAVIRVPDTQARDLAIGLSAVVDTHDGLVRGRVMRVDPASQGGTVTIDIALPDTLPKGARPDLGVDATIEIDRLANVLYVGRPYDGSSETTAQLFRVEPNGNSAQRVPVQLGRGSANAVEILSGLNEGDRVILSEMSRWANSERVRIK
jgi:multidrug efflux pump subunit AcrA (membrane-fusion protein)